MEYRPSRPEAAAGRRRVMLFGAFRFDTQGPLLARNGRDVRLGPKPLAVLQCLLERPGDVVTKQQLMDAVWGDTAVTEHSLVQAVKTLRGALGDDSDNPSYIETAPWRGYRFIAPVAVDGDTWPEGASRDGPTRPPTARGPDGRVDGRAPKSVGARTTVAGWRPTIWLVVASFAAGALLAGWFATAEGTDSASVNDVTTRRTVIPFPTPHPPALVASEIALSPDGRHVAYPSFDPAGERSMCLWRLDDVERRCFPIPGGERAINPFFSPSGDRIAFSRPDALVITPLDGGAQRIIEAPYEWAFGTGAWGPDGTIIVAERGTGRYRTVGLWKIPDSGGPPEPLTRTDRETRHLHPEVLPGGSAVLFTAAQERPRPRSSIHVLNLQSGERRELIGDGYFARYVESGHLVFLRQGKLLAAAFDVDELALTGADIGLDETPAFRGFKGYFGISRKGDLAYVPEPLPPGFANPRISWMDRRGAERVLPLRYDSERIHAAVLAPDGSRLAVARSDGPDTDIWVSQPGQTELVRLTTSETSANPVWTPDGKHIIFSRADGPEIGGNNLYRVAVDRKTPPQLLLEAGLRQIPESVSADGRYLLYTEYHPETGEDVWILPLTGESDPEPLLNGPFHESGASLSPDGRWLLYHANDSGRFRVWVRSFPDMGPPVAVSAVGAGYALWSRGGREILYRTTEGAFGYLMSVPMDPARGPLIDDTRRMFEFPSSTMTRSGRSYDVSPDSERVLLSRYDLPDPADWKLTLVTNWQDALKRRVPTRR